MSFDVGPFQELVAFSFGPRKILAEDIGSIGLADAYSADLTLQCTCAALASGLCNDDKSIGPAYRTSFSALLSAPFTSCLIEGDYEVEGRTSGVRAYFGVKEKNTVYGLDCLTDACWIEVSPSYYTGMSGWGAWVPSQEYFIVGNNVAAKFPLGFLAGERIDMWITPPSFAITRIYENWANSIFVDAPGYSMPFNAYVTITNTEQYDGTYQVIPIDADTFRIDQAGIWKGEESSGKLTPHYDF